MYIELPHLAYPTLDQKGNTLMEDHNDRVARLKKVLAKRSQRRRLKVREETEELRDMMKGLEPQEG